MLNSICMDPNSHQKTQTVRRKYIRRHRHHRLSNKLIHACGHEKLLADVKAKRERVFLRRPAVFPNLKILRNIILCLGWKTTVKNKKGNNFDVRKGTSACICERKCNKTSGRLCSVISKCAFIKSNVTLKPVRDCFNKTEIITSISRVLALFSAASSFTIKD